jgi:cysteine desulfurase / selenocysteine lyase
MKNVVNDSAQNGTSASAPHVDSHGAPLGFPSDLELTRMANEMFGNCDEFGTSPFDKSPLDDTPFTLGGFIPGAGNLPAGSLNPAGGSLPIDLSQESSTRVPGLHAPSQFAAPAQFGPTAQRPLPSGIGLPLSPSAVSPTHPAASAAPSGMPPIGTSSPFAFLDPSSRPSLPFTERHSVHPEAPSGTRLGVSELSSSTIAPSTAAQFLGSNPHTSIPSVPTLPTPPITDPSSPGGRFVGHAGVPSSQGSLASQPQAGNSQAGGVRGFSPALAAANIPKQSSGGFDPNLVRQDFPILSEVVNGKPLVWLDNAATTQKPRAVIERLSQFYLHENSNVHRAAHELARRSTDAYEAARESVARFINASSTNEIIFVRGTTEAINLIAQSFGRQNIGEGDEIIVTHLEHHANIVPWQQLCAEKKARLLVAPVDDSGQIQLDSYRSLFSSKTRLVSLSQVSNALGTVTPAREMVDIAHRLGVPVVVDGAQSVSHMRVDVQALDCDFFVFSGHKVFGPTGIGAVFGKERILNDMPPWQGGGNMIQDVTFEKTLYHAAPMRFEAGTGNIADAVGLHAALDYVQKIGIDNISRYEHELLEYGTHALLKIPGLRMIGTAANKAGVLSFVVAGIETEAIGKALSNEGIAVRSGHHCAQPILRRFGVESTVRASLAFYNTTADIDRLVSVVKQVVK